MTSLGDDARRDIHDCWSGEGEGTISATTLTSTCSTNLDSVVCKCGSVVDSSSQPKPLEIGAVMSTCACCGKAGHEKARCRFRNAKCSNCGKTGHLRAMRRQREKSAGKSSPSSSSGNSSGKGGRSRGHTDKWSCCGQVGHRRPDCSRRNESCSLCGKRGHLSQVCRSSVGNASARAVEAEPAELEEERNSTRVGTVSLRHFWNPVGRFVCLRQLRSPV